MCVQGRDSAYTIAYAPASASASTDASVCADPRKHALTPARDSPATWSRMSEMRGETTTTGDRPGPERDDDAPAAAAAARGDTSVGDAGVCTSREGPTNAAPWKQTDLPEPVPVRKTSTLRLGGTVIMEQNNLNEIVERERERERELRTREHQCIPALAHDRCNHVRLPVSEPCSSV